MSLKDPAKKMSKSQPEGCLFLDDSPEMIREKVKRAVTDSGTKIFYDPDNKPALSNLLRIYSTLTGEDIKNTEERFAGKSYAQFKEELAETIIDHFAPFRKKKADLMKKPGVLKKILREGSLKAAVVAQKKLAEAKKKVGIVL
jgi:tryptophanyl-tRNA synthetase